VSGVVDMHQSTMDMSKDKDLPFKITVANEHTSPTLHPQQARTSTIHLHTSFHQMGSVCVSEVLEICKKTRLSFQMTVANKAQMLTKPLHTFNNQMGRVRGARCR
jgi:hypothetical protein